MMVSAIVAVSWVVTALVLVLLRRPAEVASDRAKASATATDGQGDDETEDATGSDVDADANAPDAVISAPAPVLPGLRRVGGPAASTATTTAAAPAAKPRPLLAPLCSGPQAAEVGRLVGYYATAIPATPAEAARNTAAAFGLAGLDAEALGRMVEGAVAAVAAAGANSGSGGGSTTGGEAGAAAGGDADGVEALGRMVLESHAARYAHAELQARRAEEQQQQQQQPRGPAATATAAAATPAEVMARAGAYTRPQVLQAVARRMRLELLIPPQPLAPAPASSPEGARQAREAAAAAEAAARRAAGGGALLRLLWAANLTDPGMSWGGFCVYAGLAQRMGLVD
ncbi:hypothetical protein CHLRE_09g394000v5 [Chlamydomonas reinhardtii]|uniref:Uncharacterized protein n=1 Tax=Chlamydomonas reinhardtii TaxID=3055 RepID=A0A2K3DDA9_CHLRE|nr:uncharacterized protein CHLRE_09g394000v5 [Chlamydomonas reinhardtii]PNW78514.1 hypothetical protein CHLRE_09g394000v5 [Chlamydomonas reinhardtii]